MAFPLLRRRRESIPGGQSPWRQDQIVRPLPTGAVDIAGRGAQSYLQMPWSWELHDGWGVSGTLTEFFRPSDLTTKRITETTFVIEKTVTEKASLIVEYVGDYP